MNLSKLRRAYKLFSHPNTEKHIIRHNVVKYLEALNYLGDNWILSQPVQRKDQ